MKSPSASRLDEARFSWLADPFPLAIRSYFHGSAVKADLSSTGQFAQGSASMPASRESFPDRREFRSFAKRFLLLPVHCSGASNIT